MPDAPSGSVGVTSGTGQQIQGQWAIRPAGIDPRAPFQQAPLPLPTTTGPTTGPGATAPAPPKENVYAVDDMQAIRAGMERLQRERANRVSGACEEEGFEF